MPSQDPYASPDPNAAQPAQPPYGAPSGSQVPAAQAHGQYGVPAPPYALWGVRVGAFLLDVLVLIPFYILIAIGLGADSVAVVIIGYIAAIGFAIWNQIVRQGSTGQSLGKKWTNISLVRESTGQPIGAGMTLVRQIAHFLDSIACYIGYFWPLWDKKRQTFADKVCGTIVVRV